jgi:uncharacterized protein (TIGR02996 family)
MSIEGFLAAIRDTPNDDLPRLIMADWFEEHGDAERAEFIRLQVERARVERPLCELGGFTPRPTRRELELLAGHQQRWIGDVPSDFNTVWERGLPGFRMEAKVLLDSGSLPAGLERCLREGWVERLELSLERADVPDLAQCPLLAGVSDLTLAAGEEFTPDDLLPLAESPHLHCRTLQLASFPLSERLAEVLAVSLGRRLQCLGLYELVTLPDALAVLVGSPHLHDLEELGIGWLGTGNEQERVLISVDLPHRLARLTLHCDGVVIAGLPNLIRSNRLARLERLTLRGGVAEREVCAALAESTFERLEHLDLSFSHLVEGSSQLLAHIPGLAGVRTVALESMYLTHADIEILIRSPSLSGLVGLRLDGNTEIGDAAARCLAQPDTLPALSMLSMQETELTAEGVRALVSRAGNGLRYLALGANRFGREGIEAIADSPHLGRLTHLQLTGCTRDAGANRLWQSPNLPALAWLDFHGNGLRQMPTNACDRAAWLPFLQPRQTTATPQLVERLLASLRDPEPVLRLQAAEQLAGVFLAVRTLLPSDVGPRVSAALLEGLALPDSGQLGDTQFQFHATAGLARLWETCPELRTPPVEEALVGVLTHPFGNIRTCAEVLIAHPPSPRQASNLLAALDRLEPDIRARAAAVLRACGVPPSQVVPVLIEMLRDPDGPRYPEIIAILAGIAPPAEETRSVLRTLLAHESAEVRLESAFGLVRQEECDSRVLAVLETLARETETRIACRLFDEAARYPDLAGHFPLWRAGFSHAGGSVRVRAIGGLTRFAADHPEVVSLLMTTLDDAFVSIRREGTRALTSLGTAALPALPALLSLFPTLGHPEQAAVLELLRTLGPSAGKAGSDFLADLLHQAIGKPEVLGAWMRVDPDRARPIVEEQTRAVLQAGDRRWAIRFYRSVTGADLPQAHAFVRQLGN